MLTMWDRPSHVQPHLEVRRVTPWWTNIANLADLRYNSFESNIKQIQGGILEAAAWICLTCILPPIEYEVDVLWLKLFGTWVQEHILNLA
jgi:hypothetical protein